MTYLEEEHPLVFLITFLLLLLSVLLATISTTSPVSSEEEDESRDVRQRSCRDRRHWSRRRGKVKSWKLD